MYYIDNSFGVKGESSVLSKIKVDNIREYAMINGISPKDNKGKLLSKDKLLSKIKSHFTKLRHQLEEQYQVPFEQWDISNILSMKPYKFERKFKQITTQDLLDSLPDVGLPPSRRIGPSFTKERQTDLLPEPIGMPRMPPGSKLIRKEEGLTKTQKTQVRKQIKDEIDRLSDLLEQF